MTRKLILFVHVLCNLSGRELFLSNASLFVDDAEAFEEYQREKEEQEIEHKVNEQRTKKHLKLNQSSHSC